MRKVGLRLAYCCAALLLLCLAGGSARADIIYLPGAAAPVGGVGRQPESILSIQSPGGTSGAAGGVLWDGRKDVLTGDAKQGEHSKTLSFAQAGVSNAGRLRIFMDTEDQDDDLTLDSLVLTAYGSSGRVLFQGSLVAPIDFGDERDGQGHGDRVFALTADQAAQLQAAYLSDPNLRLGLSASTSDDTGSFTNFKIGQAPAAVPEPMTMLLLGTGLVGVAARTRRRMKAKKEGKG